MKLYFVLKGDEVNLHNVRYTGSKEGVIKYLNGKYGDTWTECVKKTVNLISENGWVSVEPYLPANQALTGADVFAATTYKEGDLWYLGKVSRNKMDMIDEEVANHMTSSGNENFEEALRAAQEKFGFKVTPVTATTVF